MTYDEEIRSLCEEHIWSGEQLVWMLSSLWNEYKELASAIGVTDFDDHEDIVFKAETIWAACKDQYNE